MDSQTPDLIFAYEDSPYGDEISAEFRATVAADGLNLALEKLPSTRALAGVEWLMPTAIMLFVAKSYLDGFLGEAGRDHYVALKKAVKQVADRVGRLTVTRIGTPGKIAAVQPYCPVFSIWFQRDEKTRFKFLIPVDLSFEETDSAFESFFTFVDGWHAGSMVQGERAPFETARVMGRVVLLTYSPETKRIDIVDPFAGRLG